MIRFRETILSSYIMYPNTPSGQCSKKITFAVENRIHLALQDSFDFVSRRIYLRICKVQECGRDH